MNFINAPIFIPVWVFVGFLLMRLSPMGQMKVHADLFLIWGALSYGLLRQRYINPTLSYFISVTAFGILMLSFFIQKVT